MNLLFLSDGKNVSPALDNALRSMEFDLRHASKNDDWLSRIRRENVKVDIRIISVTNRDLKEDVRHGASGSIPRIPEVKTEIWSNHR